jgi:riboflavin biosynthesis pyrimidine reductase
LLLLRDNGGQNVSSEDITDTLAHNRHEIRDADKVASNYVSRIDGMIKRMSRIEVAIEGQPSKQTAHGRQFVKFVAIVLGQRLSGECTRWTVQAPRCFAEKIPLVILVDQSLALWQPGKGRLARAQEPDDAKHGR